MIGELNEHIDCVLGKLPKQAPDERGCLEFEMDLASGADTDTYCWCCSVELSEHPEYLKKLVTDQPQLLEDLWS